MDPLLCCCGDGNEMKRKKITTHTHTHRRSVSKRLYTDIMPDWRTQSRPKPSLCCIHVGRPNREKLAEAFTDGSTLCWRCVLYTASNIYWAAGLFAVALHQHSVETIRCQHCCGVGQRRPADDEATSDSFHPVEIGQSPVYIVVRALGRLHVIFLGRNLFRQFYQIFSKL